MLTKYYIVIYFLGYNGKNAKVDAIFCNNNWMLQVVDNQYFLYVDTASSKNIY